MIPIETVAELGTCLLHLMCDRERTRNDKHVLVSLGAEGCCVRLIMVAR